MRPKQKWRNPVDWSHLCILIQTPPKALFGSTLVGCWGGSAPHAAPGDRCGSQGQGGARCRGAGRHCRGPLQGLPALFSLAGARGRVEKGLEATESTAFQCFQELWKPGQNHGHSTWTPTPERTMVVLRRPAHFSRMGH